MRLFKQELSVRLPLLVPLVSWTVFCLGSAAEYQGFPDHGLIPTFLLVAAAAPWVVGKLVADRRARWLPRFQEQMQVHTAAIDALPQRRNWLWIALSAGVGLYLELVLIRFHSSCFQLFAFFKNFSLLSCFLGLGIGYGLGGRKLLLTPLVLPLLALQGVFLHALRYTDIKNILHNPISEHWALGLDQSKDLINAATAFGFLFFVFSLNALTFIPLGQVAGRLMGRGARLRAYSWNLLGSLAGIAIFYGLSLVWAPPVMWMALGVLLLFPLVRSHLAVASVSAIVLLGVVGTNLRAEQHDIYSPYQILSLGFSDEPHPQVAVNHVYFQQIMKLDQPNSSTNERVRLAERYYNLPYTFKSKPAEVLVVGAGTGNDVAAAVRHSVGRIDAVEIDPAILALGRRLHPEKPYQNPAVRPIVNDARAHLRHTDAKYDLIVYGLLDSHTLLSGLSGVRLDSYIYTTQAFRDARSRLKPGGLICCTFALIRLELGRKLYLMMKEAFDGTEPLAIKIDYDGGAMFVIGDQMDRAALQSSIRAGIEDITQVLATGGIIADASTDDWPFFYMPVRAYPLSYAMMIVVMLGVALVFIANLSPTGGDAGFNAPCFFLGAGFMLLETKAITELALFYGSTWVVVGVVIAAILLMAFAANLLLIRIGSMSPKFVYGLLMVSLAARLALDAAPISGFWSGRILATVALTLPIFFAGLAFSSELGKARSVASALSWNLIGAMVGGALEYNSMYFGFRSLYVLALVLYGLAFASSLIGSRNSATTSDAWSGDSDRRGVLQGQKI